MTLEQLRIFVAVAEREHVSAAARALPLAQSAVSAAVSALEARHGVLLFDRIGRRITLTEAGRALLAQARGILADVAEAEVTLGEYGAAVRGALTIFASQTIAGYWLPAQLVAFRREHPKVDLKLVISNTTEAAKAVEEGRADVGFVEDIVHSERLASEPLAHDQLILVAAPSHPWAQRTKLTRQDLEAGEWVLREPGSGTRSAFERALARYGVERLAVALTLPSNESVRAAVEAGLGATALSASVAAPSLEAGFLAHIPLEIETRTFSMLRRRARATSRVADALLATIRRRIGAPPASVVKAPS
jgi:DNA-binding transcriptional LysR family regulator